MLKDIVSEFWSSPYGSNAEVRKVKIFKEAYTHLLKYVKDEIGICDMIYPMILETITDKDGTHHTLNLNGLISELHRDGAYLLDYLELKIVNDVETLVYDIANKVKTSLTDEYQSMFVRNWTSDDKIKRVVITHKNCNDGFGVDMVCRLVTSGEVDTIYVSYNAYDIDDLVKRVRGGLVYIGDFSFPKEEYLKLVEASDMIVMVDHHDTSFENFSIDMPNVQYDKTKSGAVLTWRFFRSNIWKDIPNVIKYIGDRDVWKWIYDKDTVKATSYLVSSAYKKYLSDSGKASPHFDLCNNRLLSNQLSKYDGMIEYENNKVIENSKKASWYTINGKNFLGINTKEFISETLNLISVNYNHPAFSWYVDEYNNLQLSFRSYSDDLPVNKVAEYFGGGGHIQAAGCSVKLEDININEFFLNNNLVINNSEFIEFIIDYKGLDRLGIYKKIFNHNVSKLPKGMSEDKKSRLANKCAVKWTNKVFITLEKNNNI